jgi:hypothetical protein
MVPIPADIRPEDLSPEVRRLLWHHLDSVAKLELLQYARLINLPWTSHDAAAALDHPEEDLAVAAVGLCQAGVLRRFGYGYQRTPRADLVGAAVDVLCRACGFEAAAVLQAIERLARGRGV